MAYIFDVLKLKPRFCHGARFRHGETGFAIAKPTFSHNPAIAKPFLTFCHNPAELYRTLTASNERTTCVEFRSRLGPQSTAASQRATSVSKNFKIDLIRESQPPTNERQQFGNNTNLAHTTGPKGVNPEERPKAASQRIMKIGENLWKQNDYTMSMRRISVQLFSKLRTASNRKIFSSTWKKSPRISRHHENTEQRAWSW